MELRCEIDPILRKVHNPAPQIRKRYTILRKKVHNPAQKGSYSCARSIDNSLVISKIMTVWKPIKNFIKGLMNFNKKKQSPKILGFLGCFCQRQERKN